MSSEQGKKRRFFTYDPFWRDEWGIGPEAIEDYPGDEWELIFYPVTFYVSNSVVQIDNLYWGDLIDLIITSNKIDNAAANMVVSCFYAIADYPEHQFHKRFQKGNAYSLVLKMDGDFVDVFVDNQHLCTLIAADNFLVEAVRKIILGESYNVSGIAWPRRADGSMDYPPPADMSRYSASHRTLGSLRLRDSANTSSLLVSVCL
jgi:hypothetical protein